MKMDTSGKTIGISLSGGGARGFAHVGVLQALEEHGLSPDIVCGTSAGAIIGVLYAHGYTPAEMREIVKTSNIYKVFRMVLPLRGLSSQDYLRSQLQQYVPENDFGKLKRKFLVGVTNLNSGKHEIWEDGPLHDLVVASSSVPGLFQPIAISDRWYVDGGVMNNLPIDPVAPLCDFVIASNVVTKVEKSTTELSNLKSILARVFEISLWYRSRLQDHLCDLIIEPEGLESYNLFNFSKAEELCNIGYESACRTLEALQEEIRS